MVLRSIFLAGYLLSLAPSLASGQWKPTGPYSGDIRSLTRDPAVTERVYAGTRSGGVYISEDNGETWTQRSQGLARDQSTNSYWGIYDVQPDPVTGRLYASGVEIYVSEDNGLNWTAFPRPGTGVGNFGKMYLDPDDSEKITVLNRNGVFVYDRLPDDSRVWKTPPGIAGAPLWTLVRAPSDPNRFYTVSGYTPVLYRSTNRLDSWTAVGSLPGETLRALAVDAANPSRLYLSMETGCFLSEDGGQGWTRMDNPGDDAQIYAFGDVHGELLAMGRGNVFSNMKHPDNLSPLTDFFYTPATSVIECADRSFLIGTQMGVFKAPGAVLDGVSIFTLSTQGMNNAGVSKVVPVPGSDIIYAASGSGFNGGVYRSDDNGKTWELRARGITNLDVRSIAVCERYPDVAYAGSLFREDIGENGRVYRTVDGGRTWTPTADFPHTEPRIIISLLAHPTDPDVIYASVQAKSGGIFKSTDGGQSWVKHSNGLESMPYMPGHDEFHNYYAMLSMVFDPRDPETIFLGAGGCWGGIYRSQDGGANWLRRSACCMEYDSFVMEQMMPMMMFPVHLELWDTVVDINNPNHLLTGGTRGHFENASRVGILYESWDFGDSWSLVRPTARSDYFSISLTGIAIHRYRAGEIYVSNVNGVQVSLDGGASWDDMNEGLGVQFTRGIEFDPDDPNRLLLATAHRGIWTRDLSPVAVRLTHMEVQDIGGAVELTWGVADAVNHLGFHVDREAAGERTRLTRSLLRGQDEYRFLDGEPVAGRVNRYWIVEVDRTGKTMEFGPLEIRPTAAPRVMTLGRPAPNPLRSSARMLLSPARAGEPSTVRVFDTRGRRVATLLNAEAVGAPTWVSWNGADDQGARVRAGVYFIQAVSGGQKRVQRILVVP